MGFHGGISPVPTPGIAGSAPVSILRFLVFRVDCILVVVPTRPIPLPPPFFAEPRQKVTGPSPTRR